MFLVVILVCLLLIEFLLGLEVLVLLFVLLLLMVMLIWVCGLVVLGFGVFGLVLKVDFVLLWFDLVCLVWLESLRLEFLMRLWLMMMR